MSALNMVRGLVGLGAVGVVVGQVLEKTYPAEGLKYRRGDKYTDPADGRKYFVLGYTGHSLETVQNIDRRRELYYGSKKVAQWYGLRREPPAVGLVVSAHWPSPKDHGRARVTTNLFGAGSYEPISPEGMQRAEVRIVEPELVNESTRIGTIAASKRALKAWGW
jgi:hypothetical protein